MSVSAYPLQWPVGRPRKANRKRATFGKKANNGRWIEMKELSVADALARLQDEFDRIGARQPIVSTNLETRLDGLPRSGQGEPRDPGVALYFQLDGQPHCMPCDTFDRVADNIAAIAKHIEATRAIDRFGVASIREMFTGFAALPAPGAQRPWREVLEFAAGEVVSRDMIDARYRRLASLRHPDRLGGSHDAMAELNRARDEAMAHVSNGAPA